jgi:hypothetical protein
MMKLNEEKYDNAHERGFYITEIRDLYRGTLQ